MGEGEVRRGASLDETPDRVLTLDRDVQRLDHAALEALQRADDPEAAVERRRRVHETLEPRGVGPAEPMDRLDEVDGTSVDREANRGAQRDAHGRPARDGNSMAESCPQSGPADKGRRGAVARQSLSGAALR
jgi:hypothetical protein